MKFFLGKISLTCKAAFLIFTPHEESAYQSVAYRQSKGSRPGETRVKVVSFEEAVSTIHDGDTLLIGGSGGGHAVPEALIVALKQRHLKEPKPNRIPLLRPVGIGDNVSQGVGHLACPGLLKRIVTAALVNSPAIQKMAEQDTVEAYTLPQGALSQLMREMAAGRPGGRGGGGGVWGEVPPTARAPRRSGGIVIVQGARLAERGSLSSRQVKIPGMLVDLVVVDPGQRQTYLMDYSAAYAGELHIPLSEITPLPLDPRKVIARRAALELAPDAVCNLGSGVSTGIANIAAEEGKIGRASCR